MFTVDHIRWQKHIETGFAMMQKHHEPVLISEVIPIKEWEPLAFFQSGRDLFHGERFFWHDLEQDLTLAGCGVAYRLCESKHTKYSQQTPYQYVEQTWNRLRSHALLIGGQHRGAGPLLFGGFNFDSDAKKTTLWKNFGDIHFYLPTYLLTKWGEEHFLTINLVLQPDSSPESIQIPTPEILTESLTNPSVVIHPQSPQMESFTEVHAEEWVKAVEQVIQRIKGKEAEKVVLAREVRLTFPETIYIEQIIPQLQEKREYRFLFLLESGQDVFFGASPERLVRKVGNQFLADSLAGSIPRGKVLIEDEELGRTLLHDPKNREEHQVVVEMILTAMAPLCESLEFPTEPMLKKLPYIQHLYTPIIGTGKRDTSLLDLVEKLHPTPALGGWPKEKGMALIRELEPFDRGLYGAPIGWIDGDGNGEFAVAIRSALLQRNQASLFAGCGIVRNSDPEAELQETKVKLRPMLSALGGLLNGEE